MKLCTTAPALLLLAVYLLECAHAELESTPINQRFDTQTRRKSVCLGLQRTGQVGPGCAESLSIGDYKNMWNIMKEEEQKKCHDFCENQFATNLCSCDIHHKRGGTQKNWSQVCHSICQCSCERKPAIRNTKEIQLFQIETTTEPDWATLCITLCQVGEGGALCNCDKPPFV